MRYQCHQKDKSIFQMILLSTEKIQVSQLEAPGNNEHTEQSLGQLQNEYSNCNGMLKNIYTKNSQLKHNGQCNKKKKLKPRN